MTSRGIRALSGEASDVAAWDALFRYFNQMHGKGNIGYKSGEKIVIKVNFVGCIRVWDSSATATIEDYNLRNADYMNT